MKLNDTLSRISWQDFEILVANRYRRHGWEVAHCGDGQPGLRAESGVDLRMRRNGERALVQCRHESLFRPGAREIERFLATAAEESPRQAIVIASADLPEDARQLAESGGATIIEGSAVRDLLDEDLVDVRPVPPVAAIDAQRVHLITSGKAPRGGGQMWRLPLFVAALAALGFLAFYLATFARSRLDHPLPPQVDPAVLSRGAEAPRLR